MVTRLPKWLTKSVHISPRLYSTEATVSISDEKNFSATLRLPKTAFPLWSDPSMREIPFRERTTTELYQWQQANSTKSNFVLHDGPPYANGNLHSGHALNKILKDIILRFQILQGRRVNYIPGWDCHGLPVENKALAELKAEPNSLPPAVVREAARKTAEEAIELQRSEMMKFALVGDWSREGTYRTMDHSFEIRQLELFQQMVSKGIIYRQFRPVYWSPSSKTALAEAELKYIEDHVSQAAYVKFKVMRSSIPSGLSEVLQDRELFLLIWTTTPWTLPGNMAIAVNGEAEYSFVSREQGETEILVIATNRIASLAGILGPHKVMGIIQGSSLSGMSYEPLMTGPGISNTQRSVVLGSHVTLETGTGLVHTAPSHGIEDYQLCLSIGIQNQMSFPTTVDDEGRFTADVCKWWGSEASDALLGSEVLYGGNKRVLGMLQTSGSLLYSEKYKHKYPYDWRTEKPIIIRATSQWFANLDDVKSKALHALKDVKFHPISSRRRLESFINERSEWCISRQRTWGVPIPSLHVKESNDSILNFESLSHIIRVLASKGTSYWWEGPIEEFMSPIVSAQFSASELTKGTDTMDVWFDSGTTWSLLKDSKFDATKPVADVCLEGSDQHRGWFQSLVLTAVASSENEFPSAPYRTLITHGFVLDEKGRKMSKSLGNVISPLEVIDGGKDKKSQPAHGADVLRLWVAGTDYSSDVALSKTSIGQAVEILRKLRNTLRFILGNIQDRVTPIDAPRQNMTLLDRFVLHELRALEIDTLDAYNDYNFHKVVNSLFTFANTSLSSLYFDVNKDTLYAESENDASRLAVVYVLQSILSVIGPIMAPIVPHLAEEVYQLLNSSKKPSLSIFTAGWRRANEEWNDVQAFQDTQSLLKIRQAVLELLEQSRKEKKIRSSLEAEVLLVFPDGSLEAPLSRLLYQQEEFLPKLFIVSDVSLVDDQTAVFDGEDVFTKIYSANDDQIRVCVRKAKLLKCPRCWTYTRESSKPLCNRCTTVII